MSGRGTRRGNAQSARGVTRLSPPDAIYAGEAAERIRPASREDLLPVAMAALLLAVVALLFCVHHGMLLLYGDAVAHLGIARRILDSRNPGLAQLGGVWLPLPHLLMLPLVSRMELWQNGLAGAIPSMLSYIAAVVAMYRLARRLLPPVWSVAATAFVALNPNLLYLATTAMTEPLFLAIVLWLVVVTIEASDAMEQGAIPAAARRLVAAGVLIVAAVYTRYDGWILGALVWCALAWRLAKHRTLWRPLAWPFAVMSVLAVAAPLSWLAYNAHFYGDPLDFARGPYSAPAIERRTSPPGSRHYRGWHNPGWALLFYTRTAQVDAAWWETGFAVLAAALAGAWQLWRERRGRIALLLWLPLPFYVYSISYGSVPIFIPQLYPHSFYNARYGMEMLPALALFGVIAVRRLVLRESKIRPLLLRVVPPSLIGLSALNAVGMMSATPLVLKEGEVNARTRVAMETAVANAVKALPAGVPILISTSDHIGILQQAGVPLRQVLSEGDRDSWLAALRAPAEKAQFVVALERDPVAQAVAAHPEGLTELTVICSTGQPCARIYRSDRLNPSAVPSSANSVGAHS